LAWQKKPLPFRPDVSLGHSRLKRNSPSDGEYPNTPLPAPTQEKENVSAKPNDEPERRELGTYHSLLRNARSRRIDQSVVQKHGETFDDDGGHVGGRRHHGLSKDDTNRILRAVDRREIQRHDQAGTGIHRNRDGETVAGGEGLGAGGDGEADLVGECGAGRALADQIAEGIVNVELGRGR
jgi:hypothetical protein